MMIAKIKSWEKLQKLNFFGAGLVSEMEEQCGRIFLFTEYYSDFYPFKTFFRNTKLYNGYGFVYPEEALIILSDSRLVKILYSREIKND